MIKEKEIIDFKKKMLGLTLEELKDVKIMREVVSLHISLSELISIIKLPHGTFNCNLFNGYERYRLNKRLSESARRRRK